MSDNPFHEPGDEDRTIIRPAPGGRAATRLRPVAREETAGEETMGGRRAAAVAPAAPPGGEVPDLVAPGAGPLLAAAGPLLQLMARLRSTYAAPDPGLLRERAAAAMREFERRSREAGVPPEQLRPAHFALCAALDDVVMATPWGSQGVWALNPLIASFHQNVDAGERFFEVLAQLQRNPGANLPVLEVMYLCLALGFQGRIRLSPRGPAELDRLREELHATIARQRGAAPERELSPRWQGVAAPYRPARAQVPAWVLGSAAAALLAGLFLWLSNGVEDASDALLARAQAAPSAAMPRLVRSAPARPVSPPPSPAQPAPADRLQSFLAPEIAQGLVVLDGTEAAPLVRIRAPGMFPSGSATLNPAFRPLLQRIGEALREERGPVQVIGHTDNQPIRTVAFASNYALSAARAETARRAIAAALGEPGRIAAEGRADSEPVESNVTPAGREANRRIEVLLRRQGG